MFLLSLNKYLLLFINFLSKDSDIFFELLELYDIMSNHFFNAAYFGQVLYYLAYICNLKMKFPILIKISVLIVKLYPKCIYNQVNNVCQSILARVHNSILNFFDKYSLFSKFYYDHCYFIVLSIFQTSLSQIM